MAAARQETVAIAGAAIRRRRRSERVSGFAVIGIRVVRKPKVLTRIFAGSFRSSGAVRFSSRLYYASRLMSLGEIWPTTRLPLAV